MSEVFEQVMALCARGSFTGWLRIQTREGNGEVRFVSGIQDGVRFDTLTGDAALARLESASEPEFEAIAALPPLDKNSESPVPVEGGLDRIHAATLMRYCESNSLTCALELEADGKLLTARYRLGELLSVEPDSELTAQLAEAKQGVYRFKLPRFELPASTRSAKAAPASSGTPAVAPVAARPAAPNMSAAFKPAAAPAVQPVRIAPAQHTRPTPAATPAAVRAVPSGASSARTPAAPAATASAARAASSPAAAASRPAVSAATSPARPAAQAEPVRPAPIAEVRAAPVAEPIRPTPVAAPAAPRSPAPAPAPAAASPAPAAAARAPAATPAAEKALAPAAAAAAKPAAARSPSPAERAASPARPAAARPRVHVEEPAPQRYGLVVVMALVAVALVVWALLGAPLPVH